MKDPNGPKIGDMEHRVALCRQQDIVADGKTMELHRSEVVWTWARIKSYYGIGSYMNEDGYAIIDGTGKQSRASHAITVRRGLDIEVTAAAWIYEERRKGPPRWYKILQFSETVGWLMFTAKLIEKSDYAPTPHKMLLPQTTRVEL